MESELPSLNNTPLYKGRSINDLSQEELRAALKVTLQRLEGFQNSAFRQAASDPFKGHLKPHDH